MHFFHNWTGPKMVIVRALLRVNLTQASCGLVALQHLKLAREAPRRVIAAVCPVIAQDEGIHSCDRSYMQHVRSWLRHDGKNQCQVSQVA